MCSAPWCCDTVVRPPNAPEYYSPRPQSGLMQKPHVPPWCMCNLWPSGGTRLKDEGSVVGRVGGGCAVVCGMFCVRCDGGLVNGGFRFDGVFLFGLLVFVIIILSATRRLFIIIISSLLLPAVGQRPLRYFPIHFNLVICV